VSLEQSIGGSQSVSLTNLGAIGRRLLRVTQLANLNANFPNVSYTSGTATSDYHALQLKYQRRLSRRLQALASYSFSHSIDSASTDAFATRLNTPASLANANIDRGNSDFDIRHSFTTGFTYNLPAPGSNNLAHVALGGWSLDTFVLARAGKCGGCYFQFCRRLADASPEPESGSASGTVRVRRSWRQDFQ
jgi:hypothetical protein